MQACQTLEKDKIEDCQELTDEEGMWECSCQGVCRGEEKATVVRDKGCR